MLQYITNKNYIHLVICLLAFTFFSAIAKGQILPAEGSKLNYKLVGFTIPDQPGTQTYSFEIAIGTHNSDKSFRKNKIRTEQTNENKNIILLPKFGQDYTWRVIYQDSKKHKKVTPFYHFTTSTTKFVDTAKYRLRIIDTATAYRDLLVMLDSRVMYKMNGDPVWYLPEIKGLLDSNSIVRDLKPTHSGTFTFLKDNNAFEIDYNGNVLWSAPHGVIRADSNEHYHHEFTKLPNGNYMIADQEDIEGKDTQSNVNTFQYGMLAEYNKEGKLVWQWKSSEYLIKKQTASGEVKYMSPHLNAFFFDFDKKVIYLSFRNISTILKISYPSGQVIAEYNGASQQLFRAQHNCRISKDGYLYLFNNNIDKDGIPMLATSYITVLQEPADQSVKLKKVWDFSCKIDSQTIAASIGGGSVYELPGDAFLSCMGLSGRVFIASKNKKIVWNALPEQKNDNSWIITQQYRASYIENNDSLRDFIFK